MPHFTDMDPDLIKELIKDEPDVISQAIELEAEIYKATSCPKCMSRNLSKKTDPPKIVMTDSGPEIVSSPFAQDSAIVEGYAQCQECGTEFCPRSGIIRNAGNYLTTEQLQDPHLD